MAKQQVTTPLLITGWGNAARRALDNSQSNFDELYDFLGGASLSAPTAGLVFFSSGTGFTTDAGLTYAPLTDILTVLGGIQLGHASDTTIARVASGRLSVEGIALARGPASATDNTLPRYDGITGDLLQTSGVTIDDTDNVTGIAALTATTVNVGNADTTLARAAAGRLSVEAVALVRGPGSSNDNRVARFDGATGDLVQESAVGIDDSGNLTGVGTVACGIISVSGSQTLTSRRTGWTAATGTASRAGFATTTVSLETLAQNVKALMDDLITHGIIGA